MGYMYDKLKEALGGKAADSTASVNTRWTPNNIRCLVINRSFIFVGNHTGAPRTVPLDIQEVSRDLQSNSQGALHNLLSNRQLSCMEELYVDNMFIPAENKRFMNLETYVTKLINDRTRLRFFGYCDATEVLAQFLQQKFMVMASQPDYLYSLAADRERENICKLQYQKTNNDDWYCKYNLRPNHYALDKEQGKLAVYLRKGEQQIKSLLEQQNKLQHAEGIKGIIRQAMQKDKELLSYYVYLLSTVKGGHSELPALQEASSKIILSARREFHKYKVTLPEQALTKDLDPNLLKAYSSLNLFSKGEPVEENLKSYASTGFLRIEDLFTEVCNELFKHRKSSKVLKLMIEMRAIPELKSSLPSALTQSWGIQSSGGAGAGLEGMCNFIYYATGIRKRG